MHNHLHLMISSHFGRAQMEENGASTPHFFVHKTFPDINSWCNRMLEQTYLWKQLTVLNMSDKCCKVSPPLPFFHSIGTLYTSSLYPSLSYYHQTCSNQATMGDNIASFCSTVPPMLVDSTHSGFAGEGGVPEYPPQLSRLAPRLHPLCPSAS